MAARRRMIGVTTAVGAFLALGAPVPTAHADIDDLLQPIIDALSGFDPGIAADTGPGFALSSLDTMFDSWYQSLVYTPINELDQWIFGGAADASVAGSAAAFGPDATTADTFTVPLEVSSGTEPVVNVSVGGGPESSVLVDTGSAGLVMPIWDINPFGITGLPTSINIGQFGNSVDYVYAELPTTVTFTDAAGATVTTGTTDVDAVLFAFPVSMSALFTGWNISSYLGDNADGVLGIGANAAGPTPDSIPTTALPGALGDGVLIDQKDGTLTFGADPLTGGVTVDGSPDSTLYVSFDGGKTATQVGSVMDSGGVNGTIPVSLTNGSAGEVLAAGQQVSVYTGDPTKGGTLLYDYTVDPTSANSPTIVSGTSMNTGNWLFQQNQVYVSTAGNGSMHIVANKVVTP
ncbi:PecA family PE domain-processing aspartic protease [Mycobacterium sp. P7213]|uniref:PecA family PE domain-processing aspartic protease n=1 Tax=Mycobacterium sp. P7213 TaxID=2478465 RepID=UPI001F14D19D|nr:PecA family PE domain-processing aspartic protease [Mycobacterium sp. P7213]